MSYSACLVYLAVFGKLVTSQEKFITPDSSSYIYLGDYIDGTFPNKALPQRFTKVGYTPETCYAISSSSGYKYFGLQYGGECW